MPDWAVRVWPAGRLRYAVLLGFGAVAALGQAPWDIWPAAVLSFAALFAAVRTTQSARDAAKVLWVFGFGYFAVCLNWIVEPFLVDAARHGWMAPFAIFFMAAGGAIFWGLAGWAGYRLSGPSAVAVAIALVWVEMARAFLFTGFPWVLPGHIWISTPLAQLAAIAGPHVLTLLTVAASLSLLALLQRGRTGLAGIAGLIVITLAAVALRPGDAEPVADDAPIVRLVQPNAPQDQKWAPETRGVFLARLLTHTAAADPVDLVVWPETSVPYMLQSVEQDLPLYASVARGAPLVFGIQRWGEDRAAFNSLIVLGPDGVVGDIYDKRHLVPFGEYIPGSRFLGAAGLSGLVGTGFTPGRRPGPVDLPGIGPAVPLICYEGIFAEEIRYGDERPRLLLLITNDAWFGQAVGPYQHLAQARLRAIEQGLPMVRVANTGISAMVDAQGRVVASLPLGVDGYLDVALPPIAPPTIYARWGEAPFGIFLILLSALAFANLRANRD